MTKHLGVFRDGTMITGVEKDEGGYIVALTGTEIEWIEPGKFVPDNARPVTHAQFSLPVDLVVLISSIMGFSDDDWALLAKKSEEVGADMLELNFSCPQMARKDAGHRVGQDVELVERFTEVVKKASGLPVLAKMTPNITDMIPVALAAKRGGADGIAAIHTIRSITDRDLDTLSHRGRSRFRGRFQWKADPQLS